MELTENMLNKFMIFALMFGLFAAIYSYNRDGWNAFPEGKYAPRDGLIQQSER